MNTFSNHLFRLRANDLEVIVIAFEAVELVVGADANKHAQGGDR